MLLSFFLAVLTVLPPGASSTYAREDYEAYSHSSYASPAWDPLVKEGFEAMERQDMTSGIEFLRKGVIAGCLSPIVLFKLALGYETQGSYYSAVQYYDLAREGFKKANQDHRYAKQFSENYGRALYMLGRTDKAIPVLEEAATSTEGSPWVLKLLGEVYLARKNPSQAAVYFGRYVSAEKGIKKEDVVVIHLQLARLFANTGDSENATKHYEQIVRLEPNHQEANRYLSQKRMDGQTDKFLDFFKH
ncbi:MAG: tetratricopeptide repeat protein [Deltaproteobacteria bacterium]|nr:tetratricopeptide repeat protein [Deltaproteobacteria bacterium]